VTPDVFLAKQTTTARIACGIKEKLVKNVRKQVPSILIIIALVGFPQISESIFTPVLPALSRALKVTAQTSQLTMSSYSSALPSGCCSGAGYPITSAAAPPCSTVWRSTYSAIWD
jgi:hypothetical protein